MKDCALSGGDAGTGPCKSAPPPMAVAPLDLRLRRLRKRHGRRPAATGRAGGHRNPHRDQLQRYLGGGIDPASVRCRTQRPPLPNVDSLRVCAERWRRGDSTYRPRLLKRCNFDGGFATHEKSMIVCPVGGGSCRGDKTMSLGLILVILLVIFLLGGFSGRFGGYGYGYGHGGVGIIGVILIVVIILMLLGRL